MARNRINSADEKLETAKRIASQGRTVRHAYESAEDVIFRFFRWLSSLIDKFFFSQKYLGLFALLTALLAFFVVNFERSSIGQSLTSAKTLNNVTVSPRYNSETFELSGLPSTCEIIITGEAANVNNAATRDGYCSINLEGYTEGSHFVDVKAVGYGDAVNAVAIPNEVQVVLKKKTTMQFDLTYDYINRNQLDSKYILGTPVFTSGSKINIRASQDTLNSISLVKALIDVKGQTENFEIDAPLVAYDKYGQVVNAEIVPSSVTASVVISSPSKTVPINLRITGEAPYGFAIDSLTMDHQTTTIYAPEEVLNTVEAVNVDFDLSTVVSNSDITVPVTLPSGVSGSDVTMVNMQVKLTEATSKVIRNIPIVYRNNDKGYGVSEVDITSVDVTVNGSQASIDEIDASDIVVYIDVKECEEPGTYTLPLNIETSSNPFVTFNLETPEINITLVNRG